MSTTIIWSKNTAYVPVEQKKRSRVLKAVHEYDFDDLGVARGGFFEQALCDMAFPLNTVISQQTLRMLRITSESEEAKSILNSPSSELKGHDIIRLSELVEDYIESIESIVEKNTVSTQYRRVFARADIKLGNDEVVRDIPFTSRFSSRQGIEGKLALGLINQESLIMVDHHDEDTLQRNILSMMRQDLNKIEDACWATIETYKSARARLVNLKKQQGKDLEESCLNVSNFDKSLMFKLNKLEGNEYYRYEKVAKLIDWKSKSSIIRNVLSLAGQNMKFTAKAVAKEMSHLPLHLHESFYLEYFMPRVVVEAAEVIFIIKTGWNPDPVISITVNNIKKGRGYYEIHSVKSKNNQIHNKRVFKRENQRFYELIELLQSHNKNVNKYWKRQDDSIFVTWSSKKNQYEFRVLKDRQHLELLINPYGLDYFSKKQIRDQVANILYLETNDPFLIKETLGHANVKTTIIYLNQHAIRIMSEANIRRFQDRLAATIVWAVGNSAGMKRYEIDVLDVDDRLLFPVGDNSSKKNPICDQWITSLGEMEFTVGIAEIEHLQWQIKYYQENMTRLKQNNPKHFLLYHVPRILFSVALQEVVMNSKYSVYLDEASD